MNNDQRSHRTKAKADAVLDAPPRCAADQLAMFLDLDGTIAPLAPTPDQAVVPKSTIDLLRRLHDAGAAIAIVSGRDSVDVDRMTAPLRLPYAALHGAWLKWPNGQVETIAVRQDELAEITARIKIEAGVLPGVLIEHKTLSIAIHYRNAPQFKKKIQQLATSILIGHEDDFAIQEGKMVVEIKPRLASKRAAIARFMSITPYKERIPFFAGDDQTDESAFCIVNDMNGISVKIGSGPTHAHWRLGNPEMLGKWLHSLFPQQND